MTNEEAIKILNRRAAIPGEDFSFMEIAEAIELAIDALKRPKVVYICKDKGTEYCHHTSDITMARNFEKVGDNAYAEMER